MPDDTDEIEFDESIWGMTREELEAAEIDPDELNWILPKKWHLDWSEWVPLTAQKNPTRECGKGVYRVRTVDHQGKPIPIPGALGVDKEGIMYIGQGDLCVRVGLLMMLGKNPLKCHHTFAETYHTYYLYRIAKPNNLQVQWCGTKRSAEDEEILILQYKQRFGDLPPGNRKPGGGRDEF